MLLLWPSASSVGIAGKMKYGWLDAAMWTPKNILPGWSPTSLTESLKSFAFPTVCRHCWWVWLDMCSAAPVTTPKSDVTVSRHTQRVDFYNIAARGRFKGKAGKKGSASQCKEEREQYRFAKSIFKTHLSDYLTSKEILSLAFVKLEGYMSCSGKKNWI